MDNRATMQELARMLAEKSGRSKAFSEQFVRQFFSDIREALLTENYVKIKGLGTFKLILVNERESVDIRSGERIEISAHHRLAFTPDKEMAQRINSPFESFETVILDEEATEEVSDVVASQEVAPSTVPMQEKFMENPVATSKEEKQEVNGRENAEVVSVKTVCLDENLEEENPSDTPQALTEVHAQTEELPQANQLVAGEEPMAEVEEDSEEDETFYEEDRKKNCLKCIVLSILAIALLVGSYLLGYYKIFDAVKWFQPAPSAPVAVQEDTASVAEQVQAAPMADSLAAAQDSVRRRQEEMRQLMADSQQYEQMPGAEYLIAGVLDTHEMQVGESLIRLSQKYYGDKELCKYVIFFNGIREPDVVHVGAKVRFPKLVKTTEE